MTFFYEADEAYASILKYIDEVRSQTLLSENEPSAVCGAVCSHTSGREGALNTED